MDLSVVIPARNEEELLPQQLEALANQITEKKWEVVVVDNGSTDSTVKRAASFADRIPNLRVISEPVPGLCRARHSGAASATSEFVAFCDADDVVSSSWVDSMAEALCSHRLVTGPLNVDKLNDPKLAQMRGVESLDGLPTFFGTFPYARGNNIGMPRSLLSELGGFDAAFIGSEDIEFSLRALQIGVDVHLAPGALVQYRFRTTPRTLWKQAYAYGLNRPALRARAAAAGIDVPSRLAGWKSWIRLCLLLPRAGSNAGRCEIFWTAGNRFGQLVGSIRSRTLFI